MSTAVVPDQPATTRRPRDARTFRRIAAAVILPIPALCIAVSRLFMPTFAESGTANALDTIAARPGAHTASVWLGSVVMLTLVPAFLAAARLARRSRPVLATVAAGVNLLAYLGVGIAFGGADLYYEVAARPEFDRTELVPYLDAVAAHGVAGLSIGLFVFGHILGAILLGAALWRTIPTWASIALIVSQPLHFVSFVILQNRVLDFASWGLTALGLTVCALVVLRTPNDEWDLPPRR